MSVQIKNKSKAVFVVTLYILVQLINSFGVKRILHKDQKKCSKPQMATVIYLFNFFITLRIQNIPGDHQNVFVLLFRYSSWQKNVL
jgi:hypothetical protein